MESLRGINNFLIRRNENNAFLAHVETGGEENSDCLFGCIKYPEGSAAPEKKLIKGKSIPFSFVADGSVPAVKIEFVAPSKEKYLAAIRNLLAHIHRGDIYEINCCVQFTAENVVIDPFIVFSHLDSISQAPFACLARFDDTYVLCSSPERFLLRQGSKLITQPIKGTARRGATREEDDKIIAALTTSLKDRTENIMTVDVARHDLSRIAKRGSVNVDELCAVYTFEQVHQMISTISCEVKDNVSFDEIIEATFPMASMTGAPKIRAMQLINEHEKFERGFYSGSMGVIENSGDFDFNVVIRSIIYNEAKKNLSFSVGSAITAMSDPEEEWEECMLKAQAMIHVLNR